MKVFALSTISLLVLLLALAACGDAEEEATAVPEPTQVMAAPTAMPTEAPRTDRHADRGPRRNDDLRGIP